MGVEAALHASQSDVRPMPPHNGWSTMKDQSNCKECTRSHPIAEVG